MSNKDTIDKVAYHALLFTILSSLQKRSDWLTIPIILLPIVYFLITETYIDNIDFGYFTLKQTKLILIIIPPLYCASIFFYLINTLHKNQVDKEFKRIGREISANEMGIDSKKMIDMLLPFNIWINFSRLISAETIWGIMITFLFLPAISMVILPAWFVYYSCQKIVCDFWCEGLISKISLGFSIWIFLVVVILFVDAFVKQWRENGFNENNTL
jgi:hypothetical protein